MIIINIITQKFNKKVCNEINRIMVLPEAVQGIWTHAVIEKVGKSGNKNQRQVLWLNITRSFLLLRLTTSYYKAVGYGAVPSLMHDFC